MLRYRCHVGHAFTAESVLSARAAELDRMLESMLRSHQERAALVRRMAKHERSLQNESLAAQLEARAAEYEHDAEVVRRLARYRQPIGEDEGDFLRNEAAEEQEQQER
jgi:two-component system chemotaxis response regulator CheB